MNHVSHPMLFFTTTTYSRVMNSTQHGLNVHRTHRTHRINRLLHYDIPYRGDGVSLKSPRVFRPDGLDLMCEELKCGTDWE
jgi:hypothetical protein